MSRRDEDDSVDDGPLESDQRFTDVVDTVPCPFCGKQIVEMAEVCPKCGNYIAHGEIGVARKPRWLVVTTVVLLISFILGYAVFR